jgi:hypothetical protein
LPPTARGATRCAATLVESIDAAMKPTMILITRTPLETAEVATRTGDEPISARDRTARIPLDRAMLTYDSNPDGGWLVPFLDLTGDAS